MIYLARINIDYGGAELLMEKMAVEYKRTGFEVSILYSRINPKMEERFIKANIPLLKVDNMHQSLGALNNINQDDIVITFCFLTFMALNESINKKTKIINYVVTANEMVVGSKVKNKLIKHLTMSQYKALLTRCFKNNQIVVMDQETLDITNEYYKTKLMGEMVLLSYNVSNSNDSSLISARINSRDNAFKILSVSRADMKMKAYLIDLIKHFPSFYKKHPESKLDIITFGDDLDKVKVAYDSIDDVSKKAITLYGMQAYEALKEFFENATVFIGMGTSVLDASNYSLISVPVMAYSNECVASNLFFENPKRVSAVPSLSKDAYELLENIHNLSDEQFMSLSRKSKQALLENYDIRKNAEKLLYVVNKSKRIRHGLILKYLENKRFNKAMEVLNETGKM